MISSANGCTCHVLKDGQKCIACRGRERVSFTCKRCYTGIWTKSGDSSDIDMDGLCTSCYYDG